jgi:hypothetical protein
MHILVEYSILIEKLCSSKFCVSTQNLFCNVGKAILRHLPFQDISPTSVSVVLLSVESIL